MRYPAFINAEPAHRHAEQACERAAVASLSGADGAASPRRQKHFLYEANVGAGLPVMSTLRDLIASGDEIDQDRRHLFGNAQLSIQHLRWQHAVQRTGARRPVRWDFTGAGSA